MKSVLPILCCLAAATASAEDVGSLGLDSVKADVTAAAQSYLNAVACPGVLVRPADVLALVPKQQGETAPKFALLWTGDLGCQGGTGTTRTNIVIATVNTGKAVVQPELSSPVIDFESPARYIRKVVSAGPDALVLEGLAYGPNDPNSSPSVAVRFTLRLDAKGNWKLADKGPVAGR